MAQFYSPKRKVAKISKKFQVTIDKLDHQSQGIAFKDNKILFVPGVLPGELAEVQIVEQKKNHARAKLLKVVEASDERIAADCPHFANCGGCSLQYLEADRQLHYKQQALAQRLHRAGEQARWQEAIGSSPWHYRRRARIGVRVDRKSDELVIGFRQGGSNQLTAIRQCRVLAAPFDRLFEPLHHLVDSLDIRARIGHLEVILASQGPVIVVRHHKAFTEGDVQKLQAFEQQQGVVFFAQPDSGAVKLLDGRAVPELSYDLDELTLAFQPGDFVQVNDEVNRKMVARAIDWLAPGADDKVLDLFCGMGNFSLPLAKRAGQVIGVEGVPAMVERAGRNAEAAGLDNVRFYHCDLDQPLHQQPWLSGGVDKLLLDPARDGAANVCRQLGELAPRKIVYVSCNPASLARDAAIITEQGYEIRQVAVVDMFPQTGHLESMALFVKRD